MQNFLTFILSIVFVFMHVLALHAQDDELIIQLDDSYSINEILDISTRAKTNYFFSKTILLSKLANVYLVTIDSAADLRVTLTSLASDPRVINVQKNIRFEKRSKAPNDPLYVDQWHLEKIGAENIWDETTGGTTFNGDSIVIGVIDIGIDRHHEEFSDILWSNKKEVPDNGFDDDANGYIDDYYGVSLDNGKDSHSDSEDSHGSSVIGVLGAKGNNSLGVTGINWNVKVLLFSTEELTAANAIKAYSYFAEQRKLYNVSNGREGAFIVATNSSFGMEGLFEEDAPIFCNMFNIMGEQGILSVGAAENDQGNADVFGDLPANCSSDNLIIVTNTDEKDELAVAGFGRNTIDLGAPGEMILTTTVNNNYKTVGGTSFATPLVCGSIGLLCSHPSQVFANQLKDNPIATSKLLKDLILSNVDQIDDLETRSVSGGRLNLQRTYDALHDLFPINQTKNLEIALTPNPTIDQSTLIFNKPISGFSYALYSVNGQVIQAEKVNTSRKSISVSLPNAPSGLYFLSLHYKNNLYGIRIFKPE